jgi:twitching motility protein PilT
METVPGDQRMQIDKLMEACIRHGASDIHLTVGAKPRLRTHTHLRDLETKVLEPADTLAMMKAITPERIQEEFEETGSGDFAFAFGGARFRVAVFKQRSKCALVLRKIPDKILSFAEIGLPAAVPKICERARGIFLVTGPTGSGKTTTLASIIDHMNTNFDRHIVTLEDPIEYEHPHKKSLVNQREIGVDVPNFPEGLRRVLRQDPDVILVGEMRDLETIRAAMSAAETGHLVFATLHTSGASSTVNRIIDVFPTNEQEHIRVQLAGSLIAVLSQTLCQRADNNGVVAAYEFMHVTPAIQNFIRNNKPFQIDSDIQTGRKHGMQLLDDHLVSLVKSGVIKLETGREKSRDPGTFAAKCGVPAQ